jgi:TRAP-type C4-dicarboxylate transport system substrate-binding protein
MNMRAVLRVLILAAITGLANTAGHAQAQTTWRLANEYPATSLPGEADIYFARLVAQTTAGKLLIEPVADAKSGMKTRDQLAAVAKGEWAMADSFAGALSEDDPLFLLSSLPFLAPTAADARRLYEAARPAYEKLYAARGQKLLYVSPWPPSGIWSAVPVTDPESLRQLKIRTYDSTGTEIFKHVGASAQTISFADLPARMEGGQINAVLSSGDGGAARHLWDKLKHFSEIGYAIPLSLTAVNLEAYNRLDADTRAAVDAAAKETSEHQWQAMRGRVEQNYARMREQGMRIASPAPATVTDMLREAGVAALGDWQKRAGAPGQQILEAYWRRQR